MKKTIWTVTCIALISLAVLNSCYKPVNRYEPWQVSYQTPTLGLQLVPTESVSVPSSSQVPTSRLTPTPDVPRPLPTLRSESVSYTVQVGDTLAKIALAHQVSIDQILDNNALDNPNMIEIGQMLIIPPTSGFDKGSSFKIIPDSELVYGPATAGFILEDYVADMDGYLGTYHLEMDEGEFSGAAVVLRVANEYSINPRLLLALLEFRSQWVSNASPDPKTVAFPLGYADPYREGLYNQLAWAANELNRGFYLWMENALAVWTLADGTVLLIDPSINAGTSAVQYFFSLLYGRAEWEAAVSATGLFATYQQLFGYPFDYAVEPLIPQNLEQPTLYLPFDHGDVWSYTSGPHGGWNDGSAWAALDFAPPGEAMGCFPSSVYVTAAGEGVVVRSGLGAVVQDLDGDGIEQTGWTILYMHIWNVDNAKVGDHLKVGDAVGYASCDGGYSSGTHLHIARRYNGMWISAYGDHPFIMDGWIATSAGIEYDGFLNKNGVTIEAWNGRADINQVGR